MFFPYFDNTSRSREITNAFGGINKRINCGESEFSKMQNMTADYYPVLSPRKQRGIVKSLTSPVAITEKESLVWIDDGKLYIDGEMKTLSEGISFNDTVPKNIVKMGSSLIIMPDKIWYDTESDTSGHIDNLYDNSISEGAITVYGQASFTLADSLGRSIVAHDAYYYENNNPVEGDYKITSVNGRTSLSQWASSANMWTTVTTTYMQISATGIGKGFEVGDGVKITVDVSNVTWEGAENVFVNDEGNGKRSTNTWITDRTDNGITITGIIPENVTFGNIPLWVERKAPDLEYVTECNNRLWGCSKDGHEVYCTKLGDYRNWTCYQGISTDSWAATVGSEGKFTGAASYMGYPVFFKENSMLRITISSVGAHATNEVFCKGVQQGSSASLRLINSVLYYKSTSCVCAYQGSVPYSVSDDLGNEMFSDAVAGSFRDKYYISMKDEHGSYSLFVYDTSKGLWHREDSTKAIGFATLGDELYILDSETKKIYSVNGTLPFGDSVLEDKVQWAVVTGNIGYNSPDNKYCGRINVRISLDYGSEANLLIQYDDNEQWEQKLNMSNTGTKTFTIPVTPRRCDHFRIMLSGVGTCKIHSITKIVEEGSDI